MFYAVCRLEFAFYHSFQIVLTTPEPLLSLENRNCAINTLRFFIGVLLEGQNSPQKCKYDLYNEEVSVEFSYQNIHA
jgi:hypothetical protein